MNRTLILGGILSAMMFGCGTPDAAAPEAPSIAQKTGAITGPSCANIPGDLTQLQSALAAAEAKAQSAYDTYHGHSKNPAALLYGLQYLQDAVTQANNAAPYAGPASRPGGNGSAYVIHNYTWAIYNDLWTAGHWLMVDAVYDLAPGGGPGQDAYNGFLLTGPARNLNSTLDIDSGHCYMDASY